MPMDRESLFGHIRFIGNMVSWSFAYGRRLKIERS